MRIAPVTRDDTTGVLKHRVEVMAGECFLTINEKRVKSYRYLLVVPPATVPLEVRCNTGGTVGKAMPT